MIDIKVKGIWTQFKGSNIKIENYIVSGCNVII